jgi:dipeptidyl aminopeptidase/acylaminoacyl peptidase
MTDRQRREGIVIKDQSLTDFIRGRYNEDPGAEDLFLQDRSEQNIPLPATHQVNKNSRISLSPDGRYALVTAYFRKPESSWANYERHTLRMNASRPIPAGSVSVVYQFFLLSCELRALKPLLEAPALYSAEYRWAADSHSIFLKTYLPLEGQSASERSDKIQRELPVEVTVPDRRIRRLFDADWSQGQSTSPPARPSIFLEENVNSPPKIYARDDSGRDKTLILDLNPQFAALDFGRVQEVTFFVHGIAMKAGVYLPPDYTSTKRYPLVIQTHGYDPGRFSMDGMEEWSSGFAARPLAAVGIIVLQAQAFANQRDYDKVGADRSLGATLEESFKNFMSLVYEQGIEYLDKHGMIDRDNVGISGFSRTVWFVSYTLTHSRERFRATVLTDGIDGGYFQYIADRLTEFDADNGGVAPFGDKGLQIWMKVSPGFNLDKVNTPVRLVSISSPLYHPWEWFVGLKLLRKPVDLITIPGGAHLLERPWDRRIAMQGIVDWYRFWLQGYSDPDFRKSEQYERWNEMKLSR